MLSVIETKFKNCTYLGKVSAAPMFEGRYIKVFELPEHDANYTECFGAIYPDGATMLWPKHWLVGKKLIKKERVELKIKRVVLQETNGKHDRVLLTSKSFIRKLQ